jgi:AraC family transcriptional regulator
MEMNSEKGSDKFTSSLFIENLAPKHSHSAVIDRERRLSVKQSPLVQTVKSPDTSFQRVISDRILLEHRFHHIANEVPECSVIKAGLVINIGQHYQAERWIDGSFRQDHIQQGDFTVFPAGTPYRVVWDRPVELMMIGFDPRLIQQKADELDDRWRNDYDLATFPRYKLNDPLIHQISLALKTELHAHESIDQLYTESLIDTLLVHLLRRCAAQPDTSGAAQGLANAKLRQVLDYIHENITDNLSLAELAAVAQMGAHHFTNLFKQSTGLSPYQYVIQQRLAKAQELLKTTDRSIVEIAIESGFSNQSHLTTAFQKNFSITPKKYRDRL